MKICAIICEFNPFHNGHKYLIGRAKEITGCDFILCVMSGSFTQRGDVCILDKITRAGHAIKGGADCVLELPAAFCAAPADIFARGAVNILSAVPEVTSLAFGCETPDADFYGAAQLLIQESTQFKATLQQGLSGGDSYIKSYANAFAACGGDRRLLECPNNVLGVEYAKAIVRSGANIRLVPVGRMGAPYGDNALRDGFSSAGAIRAHLHEPAVRDSVPPYVWEDLKNVGDIEAAYRQAARCKLFFTPQEQLKRVSGCGEGLENALKGLQNLAFDEIIEKATSRRYSSARIRRILCANLLQVYEADSKRYLSAALYLRALAVKKQSADGILPLLAQSAFLLIADGGAAVRPLSAAAAQCLAGDAYAHALFSFLAKRNIKDNMVII